MDTANARLRRAREGAGYETAVEAADALGVKRSTYIGHENGHRGFPAGRAPAYARKFKVSEEWLLYGKVPPTTLSAKLTDDDLEKMLEVALRELPAGTPLGDFPRIVGPALRVQLERFQADRAKATDQGKASAPDKAAQSPASTKPNARA